MDQRRHDLLVAMAPALMTLGGGAVLVFLAASDKAFPWWQWALAWSLAFGGLALFVVLWIQSRPPPTGWFALWNRQRKYEAFSQQEEGRWTESLLLDRHGASGTGVIRCEVRAHGGATFIKEVTESGSQVKLRFPSDFLESSRPVRPPTLPDGIYDVTWRIQERAARFTSRRTLYSRFVAVGRPRWEKVHHDILPEDMGSVRLLWDGETPYGLRCRVHHLGTGATYEMTKEKAERGILHLNNSVAVLFPDAFKGPVPPTRGAYEATWLQPGSGYIPEGEDWALDPIVVHEFVFDGAWFSQVNAIVYDDDDDRMFTINLKLYTPDGAASFEPVSAELTVPDWDTPLGPVEATWNDHNLSEGDISHYSLFYPSGEFGLRLGGDVENGQYVLRWRKKHGAGWRYVDKPHHFEVRDGVLVTDE